MAKALALRRKGRREAVSTSALLGYQPTLTLPCLLAGALQPPGAQRAVAQPTAIRKTLASSFTLIFLVWGSTIWSTETHHNFPEMAGPTSLPITVFTSSPKYSAASTLLNVTSHIKVNLEY